MTVPAAPEGTTTNPQPAKPGFVDEPPIWLTRWVVRQLTDVGRYTEQNVYPAAREFGSGYITYLQKNGIDPHRRCAQLTLAFLKSVVRPHEELFSRYRWPVQDEARQHSRAGLPMTHAVSFVWAVSSVIVQDLLREGGHRYGEAIALSEAVRRIDRFRVALLNEYSLVYSEEIRVLQRTEVDRLRSVLRVIQAASSRLTPAELPEPVLQAVCSALDMRDAALWQRRPGGFRLLGVEGPDQSLLHDDRHRRPSILAALDEAAASDQPVERVVLGDAPAKVRSVAFMAIRFNEKVLGVVAVSRGTAERLTDSDREALTAIAGALGPPFANALEHESLVLTDELTGLANRRALERAFGAEMALPESVRRSVSLLLVDVNNLKCINDNHGHQAGDRAIGLVARALAESVRPSDLAVRMGGDEFALLLFDGQPSGLPALALRVQAAVDRLHPGSGLTFPVSVACGGSLTARPADWLQLYNEADGALYRAKRGGLLFSA